MGHQQTILSFLASAEGPICDDCLSSRTGIAPRQTVNLNCRRLEASGDLVRAETMACHYCEGEKICNLLAKEPRTGVPRVRRAIKTADRERKWHWEGNVQQKLVDWLICQGWTIASTANTAAKAAGKDIVAERDGRTLWVSVKGFPRGTERTNPSTQARHWFCHAAFDLVLYRDESETVELALGLPDGFTTYLNLSERVTWLRYHLPFRVYWVSESGAVRVDGS